MILAALVTLSAFAAPFTQVATCVSNAASAARDHYKVNLKIESRSLRELTHATMTILQDGETVPTDYLDINRVITAEPGFGGVPGVRAPFIKFNVAVDTDEVYFLLPGAHHLDRHVPRTHFAFVQVKTPDDETYRYIQLDCSVL